MDTEHQLIVEDKQLLENTLKTVSYLFSSVQKLDYESARLEFLELKIALVKLEEIKIKRERRQQLADLVENMQKRGIQIDTATHSSFLKINAKNAAEIYRNNSEIHKKKAASVGASRKNKNFY